MVFDAENGSIPEYIYGNYFERVSGKMGVDVKKEESDDGVCNVGGLKELIDQCDSGSSRIIHRNVIAASLRWYVVLFSRKKIQPRGGHLMMHLRRTVREGNEPWVQMMRQMLIKLKQDFKTRHFRTNSRKKQCSDTAFGCQF